LSTTVASIEFSDEQSLLLETAASFCRDRSPIERVRAGLGDENGCDAAVWQEMVDLGWLGIAAPLEHGGSGLGLAGVVPVVECMGRHLMGSPYVATIQAIEALLGSASDEQLAQWLPTILAGAPATVALMEPDGSWDVRAAAASGVSTGNAIRLRGTKTFVLDAAAAELIVTSIDLDGETRLVALRRDQLPDGALNRETVIDETRRSYSLVLDGIRVPRSQILPGSDFERIERAALLLVCAEIAGGLCGVLHTIVGYLTTRRQFDRLIGSYQALKHPTAEILLAAERSKSHLYHAATTIGRGGREAEVALRMAKAQGSEAFAWAGDRAVQFHGGFGFTYECDAQLFLRRALWCQYQLGDERYHRRKLAPLLLAATDAEH
jgi:alkylation response protein AidB-like acyl-CoA dehydrogenase